MSLSELLLGRSESVHSPLQAWFMSEQATKDLAWERKGWHGRCVRRVHTLEVPVVQDMADLYRSIDGAASAALLVKLAVEKSYNDRMEETRNALQVHTPCC